MLVVLTGGGTGGHVVPNLAVIEGLKKQKDIQILYIGSHKGPERVLVEDAGVQFKAISCGKMRRYFSWENFLDFFRFWLGIFQAWQILKETKPKTVFSKGGYVGLPVAIAAHILKIPVIIHESDASPGLANKLSMKLAKNICLSFEESKKYLSRRMQKKVVVTGNPVRESILSGRSARGFEFTGLKDEKAVILVIGGSQGAEQINNLVKESLDILLDKFQIVHITGKDKTLNVRRKNYVQYEYLDRELRDIYAMADLVISRGGANSLAELAMLKKKAVILPLSLDGSRGDQIENAKIYCAKYGWSMLAGKISAHEFADAVEIAILHKINENLSERNGVEKIVEIITK